VVNAGVTAALQGFECEPDRAIRIVKLLRAGPAARLGQEALTLPGCAELRVVDLDRARSRAQEYQVNYMAPKQLGEFVLQFLAPQPSEAKSKFISTKW